MGDALFQYHRIEPTTWVYLSSFLMIGLFFKFNRIWSVRNLDLILLILVAPGLLMVHHGARMRLESQRAAKTVAAKAADTADPLASGTPSSETDDAELIDADKRASQATTVVAPSSPANENETGKDDATKSDGGTNEDDTVEGNKQPGEKSSLENPERASPATDDGDSPTAPEDNNPTYPPGSSLEWWGYACLLGASGLWTIRLLIDSTMTRRPLLEPNLTVGGLTFLGLSLIGFLAANIITTQPTSDAQQSVREANDFAGGQSPGVDRLIKNGPGYYLVMSLPRIGRMPFSKGNMGNPSRTDVVVTAKVVAIVSQVLILAAMVIIGYWHFDNVRMGIGPATLYLMLPATTQFAGHVDQALPAALLLWAVVFYRRPLEAGLLLGLAMGTTYYALYLLPLWLSFYWQRGLLRFVLGVLTTMLVLAFVLWLCSADMGDFWNKFRAMFGLWSPKLSDLDGVWNTSIGGWSPWFRWPFLVLFVLLTFSFTMWPAQKNLGTLLSCTAAVMAFAQFWNGHGGGMYVTWFLPLALLTVFRPNLEDRIALTVLGEGWFPKSKRARLDALDQAA
jgi:hypothetical protein